MQAAINVRDTIQSVKRPCLKRRSRSGSAAGCVVRLCLAAHFRFDVGSVLYLGQSHIGHSPFLSLPCTAGQSPASHQAAEPQRQAQSRFCARSKQMNSSGPKLRYRFLHNK